MSFVRFYRSARGEECDFVLEGRQSIAIEVKSTETPTARDVAGGCGKNGGYVDAGVCRL